MSCEDWSAIDSTSLMFEIREKKHFHLSKVNCQQGEKVCGAGKKPGFEVIFLLIGAC